MRLKNAASQLTTNTDRKHQQKEKLRNCQDVLSSPAAFSDLFAVLLKLFENRPSNSSKTALSFYPYLLDNQRSIDCMTTKPYMMAEVFGVVSAGVGVAAATGQLIDSIMKLHSFCSQIRNIPDDIQTAVDDLSTMVEVLEFVQVEMDHETLPPHPSNLSSSMKVLSNLQQSSQQVGEVLEEMRMKVEKKKYWGRIKAVGMTKKLEKAGKRVENAQRMVLILLAAENRHSAQYTLFIFLANAHQDDVSTKFQRSEKRAYRNIHSHFLNFKRWPVYWQDIEGYSCDQRYRKF